MRSFIFLLWISCIGLPLFSQSPTLGDFKTRFEEELGKVVKARKQKEAELRRNYIGALLRIESNAKRQGDLVGVEAARSEIKRVEVEPKLEPENPSNHAEIARMQNVVKDSLSTYRTEENLQVQKLVKTVREYIDAASSHLVQQDRIEDAVSWRNWGDELEKHPRVAEALAMIQSQNQVVNPVENPSSNEDDFHPALKGTPGKLVAEKVKAFPGRAQAYIAGNEPQGKEKRIGTAKIPSAAGAGNSILSGRAKLIEEEITTRSNRTSYSSSKSKSHLYVARLEFAPLPGKKLDRTLVVFDLYKRGGNRREVIRTYSMILPKINSGQRVVVDSGPYRYESYKYRSSFGYRHESATADEFYGYVVSLFDGKGELFYQRATEDVLEDYARTSPPRESSSRSTPPMSGEGNTVEAVSE